ncbi:F-box domain-containing protein [Entamoeba marina]
MSSITPPVSLNVDLPDIRVSQMFRETHAHPDNSIFQLPSDTINMICKNLDVKSFMTFTSTNKALHNIQKNPLVFQPVFNLANNPKGTINEAIAEQKRRNAQEIQRKKRANDAYMKWKFEFKREIYLAGRRCFSNVFLESIALCFMFIFILLYPMQLDRFIDVGHKVLAWLLFPVALYYGFFPHFLWCFVVLHQNDEKKSLLIPENRNIRIYGGSYDYFNQLMLWSSKGGFRLSRYVFICVTYILYLLHCYDLFSFYYVLIPVLVYSGLYTCLGSINCNPYIRENCWAIGFSCWRFSVMVPSAFLLFVGILLCILRAAAIIEDYYVLCTLPISIMLLIFPFLFFGKCCGSLCCEDSYDSCRWCYGIYEHDDGVEEHELATDIVFCTESWFFFPILMTFVILLSLILDGYSDMHFTPIFSLVWYCFFFYIMIIQVTTLIISCIYDSSAVCCPALVPSRFEWAQKYLCCSECEEDNTCSFILDEWCD